MAGPDRATRKCLVLGASGYVGSRLVSHLAAVGYEVRAAARSVHRQAPISGVSWQAVDVADADQVSSAVAGVDIVFYLVHSLEHADFPQREREAAQRVARAADRAGVRQLVYLGGPRPDAGAGELSAHLASRAAVGDALLACQTPALVLQASMIIGAGCSSFSLLVAAAQLPVLPCPDWMWNRSSPVGIGEVLDALAAAAALEQPVNGIFDLPGPEIVTYLQLLQRYADVAGRTAPVAVPAVRPPGWLIDTLARRITGQAAGVASALVESLRHDLVPTCPDARTVLDLQRGAEGSLDIPLRAAVRSLSSCPKPPQGPGCFHGSHSVASTATADTVFSVITAVGGRGGWPGIPGVWWLRGLIDRLLGGAGPYIGRARRLDAGQVCDSWRVIERGDRQRTLVLYSRMRMPGHAWLIMRARPKQHGHGAVYDQTVLFLPDGVLGTLYWRLQKPAHDAVFAAMAHGIVRAAEKTATASTTGSAAAR